MTSSTSSSKLSSEHGNPEKSPRTAAQISHAAIIVLVLSKAIKIQKETRGRRYRDLHGKLDDAVDALELFQHDEYPPVKEKLPDIPEWMSSSASNKTSSVGESVKDFDPNITDTNGLRNLEKTMKEMNGDSAPQSNETAHGEQEEILMHPVIIKTTQSLCTIMVSQTKSPKMAELALECITILISSGYIIGKAGLDEGITINTSITQNQGSSAAAVALRSKENGDSIHSTGDQSSQSRTLVDELVESITRCSESSSDTVQTAMTKALLALMINKNTGVHESALLMSIRATFHVFLVSKITHAKEVSRATLQDMLRSVFNRMEAYDAMTGENNSDEKSSETNGTNSITMENSAIQNPSTAIAGSNPNSQFASQFHTDAYLVFRALCKLSAKALPGESDWVGSSGAIPLSGITGGTSIAGAAGSKLLQSFASGPAIDPLSLQSKILSLELILSIFDHCGNAFCTGEKFIYAVQNYLCVSLLKNCMSAHTKVAFLSLKIFLLLVYKFKSHLNSEIEIFVANIFLRVLESPNSSFDQKALVLEALRALCHDKLMLTQLFLNFDCDFDAVDLYKNIVFHLTKIACGRIVQAGFTAHSKMLQSQETTVCHAGLEVLVVILRTFLKALGLPGGDDELDDSVSPMKSRLNLEIGLAVNAYDEEKSNAQTKTDDINNPDIVTPSDTNGVEDSSAANQIVDVFELKRTSKKNFETGAVRFTLSMKSGLLYFIKNKFMDCDAQGVALFLAKHKDNLDKTQIGEVLGKEPDYPLIKGDGIDPEAGGKGFFVKVLHYYANSFNFSNIPFDDAIRLFLAGFRLPGEAQKIDRIMEKFAERFTRQNEDVFPSADTAFILAFSVIMLNTDLHNPSIKPEKRMTLEGFIRNNRGISVDGGDLPNDFLEGIFKRIQSTPFSLKEDDDARERENEKTSNDIFTFENPFLFDSRGIFGQNVEDRRREKFREEKEEMMAASELLIKKRAGKLKERRASLASTPSDTSNQKYLTESIPPAEVVKPMFDVTWGPLMGTLSQVMETTTDQNIIALCLTGFVYSVRIASHSSMSLAKDTFITALAKFTTLGSIKEMQYKNIESIQTLLSIAVIDGEFLGESWGPVLQCISQLSRLRMFASGLAEDDQFLGASDAASAVPTFEKQSMFRQASKTVLEVARETEESNSRVVLEAVNEILIDKVFHSSVKLSPPSMVHFIEQLIKVSAAEISGDTKKGISGVSLSLSNPRTNSGSGLIRDSCRIFSLQKLVEVADYNMDIRPRLVWTQMWQVMANHFATVGCHENVMLSMFAIDALRQLSFKFLEKPELHEFNFQRLFLRPFLLIMENPGSRDDVRELILRCVDNMIRSLSHNLRSGWKIFFSILILSARNPNEKISTLGLAILQRLLDEHLDELCRRNTGSDHENPQNEPTESMTSFERRIRNANAEDFVGLCHASLSFVQIEEVEKLLPIGLSMRALCHTACYADLIAQKRVLPPVSSQSSDPLAFGYTYEGLQPIEAEYMVLWRPLLDGLAAGMCSSAKSNSGGVGCLVQKGSVMTLRAILLRHGHLFSVAQWSVILRHVILPAIQSAVEFDTSPVVNITSESPLVSSVEFLCAPLPLPPRAADEGLQKFAVQESTAESAPSRSLGEAELLVEASFADLRHGGDGNLSRAYGLSKENSPGRNVHEQPFPDSWLATTAPLALGMLTDIVSEQISTLGDDVRKLLWPIVLCHYQLWIIGPSTDVGKKQSDDISVLDDYYFDPLWRPCEAVVRIGCCELNRMLVLLSDFCDEGDGTQSRKWCGTICAAIAETLSKNVALENAIYEELTERKLPVPIIAYSETEKKNASGDVSKVTLEWAESTVTEDTHVEKRVATLDKDAIGGLDKREDQKLCDADESDHLNGNRNSNVTNLERFVPALKVRCVAAFALQHHLPEVISRIVDKVEEDDISVLLAALDASRGTACAASVDVDLALAFQKFILSEWEDGVGEVERNIDAVGAGSYDRHLGGSGMFFLTQEADANRSIIQILSFLYLTECTKADVLEVWDHKTFAEPLLLERISDILDKFLLSERKDGHLVDPNFWRNSHDTGEKFALYCTSSAGVVCSILKTLLKFSSEQFYSQKKIVLPYIFALVRVRSDEIRDHVSTILNTRVANLLGIDEVPGV